jgi:hypothetical protein
MKYKCLKIIFLFMFSMITQSYSVLSDEEIEAGKTMGLGKSDLLYIKKITEEKIVTFMTDSPRIKENNIPGINVFVDFDKTYETQKILHDLFNNKGYIVFVAREYYNR